MFRLAVARVDGKLLYASGSQSVLCRSLGIRSQFPEICGCTSVMANMKFMYFFNEKNDVLLKITEEIFQLVVCLL
jgi:hypothetical protein